MIYATLAVLLALSLLIGTLALGRKIRRARAAPPLHPEAGSMAGRIGLATGSPMASGDFRFEGPGLNSNPPLAALLLLKDGEAQVVLGDPPDSAADRDDWETASNALAYLVYAIGREDWCAEWAQSEHQLRRQFEEGIREIERDRLRNSFRVIDGGAGAHGPAEGSDE